MLLICMSIAGTVPLIICLLLLLLQRKKFSYRLGRNLVFLSLAGYLIPFQVVKYLMPTDVLIRTDALANISYYINFDDKGAISYHGISLWMSDWILMIGLCWLFLISGFSVYEIIKYHRLTRKLKKITELSLLTLLLYTSFSENIADQAATEGFTTEEKKAYAIALVTLSARNRQVPVVWKNNLLGAKHTMKRRVEFIMMKNKKASKIGTAAAILASVFLSGTTVFGYAPMQTTEAPVFSPITESSISFEEVNTLDSQFSNSDIYFETEDHFSVPVTSSDLESRALICTHDFKEGYADRHYPNSNGGCTVKTYTAKICQKCNHLVIMDYVGTRTYAKCPHK